MSLNVFLAILLGAATLACWHSITKALPIKEISLSLIMLCGGLISVVSLPFLPTMAISAWPYLLASLILQLVYYPLIGKAYTIGSMTLIYPIMRGTAPVLIAVFSLTILGDTLNAMEWIGILLISLGILVLALANKKDIKSGFVPIILALLIAFIVSIYTVLDGLGIRASQSPLAYGAWLYLLICVPVSLWNCRHYHISGILAYTKKHACAVTVGGIASVLSYSLTLWAMNHAAVPLVAALRETSILFTLIIAIGILGEKPSKKMIISSFIVTIGIMVLRIT